MCGVGRVVWSVGVFGGGLDRGFGWGGGSRQRSGDEHSGTSIPCGMAVISPGAAHAIGGNPKKCVWRCVW